MKKVLVAYASVTGNTEKMAEFIAEGVRITGHFAEAKKISGIKSGKDLEDYDGYVFGSPTYHRDMIEPMKQFLFLAKKGNLGGKIGGSFGSNTHSGDAAKLIFETMEFVFQMKMVDLGPFNLHENVIDTREGMRACHDYGKAVGEKLGA
jgi:flavodoxin